MYIQAKNPRQSKRQRRLPGAGRAVEQVTPSQRDPAVSVPARRLGVQVLVYVGEDLEFLLLVQHDGADVPHRPVRDLVPAAPPRVPPVVHARALHDRARLVVPVVLRLGVREQLLDGL